MSPTEHDYQEALYAANAEVNMLREKVGLLESRERPLKEALHAASGAIKILARRMESVGVDGVLDTINRALAALRGEKPAP
jgi:hypothetical protein